MSLKTFSYRTNMSIKDDSKLLCIQALALNNEVVLMEVSNTKINKTLAVFSSTASFWLYGQSTLAKTGTVPYKLRPCSYVTLYKSHCIHLVITLNDYVTAQIFNFIT